MLHASILQDKCFKPLAPEHLSTSTCCYDSQPDPQQAPPSAAASAAPRAQTTWAKATSPASAAPTRTRTTDDTHLTQRLDDKIPPLVKHKDGKRLGTKLPDELPTHTTRATRLVQIRRHSQRLEVASARAGRDSRAEGDALGASADGVGSVFHVTAGDEGAEERALDEEGAADAEVGVRTCDGGARLVVVDWGRGEGRRGVYSMLCSLLQRIVFRGCGFLLRLCRGFRGRQWVRCSRLWTSSWKGRRMGSCR
jgi:hypothetical protein